VLGSHILSCIGAGVRRLGQTDYILSVDGDGIQSPKRRVF
jgi:hypothetical protein